MPHGCQEGKAALAAVKQLTKVNVSQQSGQTTEGVLKVVRGMKEVGKFPEKVDLATNVRRR